MLLMISCSLILTLVPLMSHRESSLVNEPRESSLVDEIMSELKIQQSNSMQSAHDSVDNIFETDNSNTDSYFEIKRKSVEFDTMETELSSIKSVDVTVMGNDSDFCCSGFLETEAKVTQYNMKKSESLRKHAPNASAKEIVSVDDTLAELRTRLVQLRKDRISIRDRKQQISSETDREFLEAEYERLNWECKKVTDEIKTIEQGKGADCKIDSNQYIDIDIESVPKTCNSEENTQTVNADKHESNKACSTSSDYVIDKLTKDFEHKLFMTEN